MILLPKSKSLSHFQKELGGNFSFIEKIKLKGTGSSKVIYLNGINAFDEITIKGQNLNYVNFELFPNGITIRFSKQGIDKILIITREEIKLIHFESRKIQVRNRYRTRIVHDSKIEYSLYDKKRISFYSPVTFYKPMKAFLTKGWLAEKSEYTMCPSLPVIDKEGSITASILSGF